jgi:IS1 family transposase
VELLLRKNIRKGRTDMLISYIFVNEESVDIVYMHNQTIEKNGKFLYKVWKGSDKENVKEVWHKRDDGWTKLLMLSLKKLETKVE